MPIKYLGSKRRLVPALTAVHEAVGARCSLDLFTGTTRVAQAFKAAGGHVTAVDTARYSEIFARAAIETDADEIDRPGLEALLVDLAATPPVDGYFTDTFCRRSRFFQEHNGRRVDAIRQRLADEHSDDPWLPILLTSLIEAADRVDSTTGVQMAYVKRWAKRSYNDLQLRVPALLAGPGRAVRGDAVTLAGTLGSFDLAYLDPPYNQHRYFTNYHVWETLVAWDAPEHYGVACKRIDARDPATKSPFNAKRAMPEALASVIAAVDAELLVVSHNDESWVSADALREMCDDRGAVEVLAFDSKRYVGAQIGIHNPDGVKTGTVGRLRNRELLALAGPARAVSRAAEALAADPSRVA